MIFFFNYNKWLRPLFDLLNEGISKTCCPIGPVKACPMLVKLGGSDHVEDARKNRSQKKFRGIQGVEQILIRSHGQIPQQGPHLVMNMVIAPTTVIECE